MKLVPGTVKHELVFFITGEAPQRSVSVPVQIWREKSFYQKAASGFPSEDYAASPASG